MRAVVTRVENASVEIRRPGQRLHRSGFPWSLLGVGPNDHGGGPGR